MDTRDKLYQINQVVSDGIKAGEATQKEADEACAVDDISVDEHMHCTHAIQTELNRLKAIRSIIRSCDINPDIAQVPVEAL